ncbi:hypothetical protein ACCD06_26500 [Azospirillum sp. CT11-132]|jgi:hypothetical protein|uniref:Uncharacterized protein n=1 Tax=Azospirillum oryzae TaxID=286727 RepID=A0A6N1AR86_9PROT|nr:MULTISPECIES: hypothetical protein [Azospirillum]KAA0574071.1 hypothetical protein FZ029_19120 [Azospirillum sp. Sh1]KAA0587003.1 hypothetical protein FZ938_19785 [Azospirillum oryzae]MCM8736660.1 hypothetical protein [Azospirillum sp. A1-3]PWC56128.1 hypothetical protein TSH7_28765 [Azospirillum sp. TSH7]PWC57423.1 hypothetical protein TSH20_31410 [Azospirillum sp. TSH20]
MARKKKKKGGGLTLILLIIPAALIVLPTTILFGIGMIPTIVAYVVDRDPDKSAPITVGGLNFCGCMPFAIDLWKHQHTIGAAAKVFADPLAWLVMYSAAAVGWGLYYGIPPLVAGMEVTRAEKRVEVLKQKKVALVQEWGPDVAGDYFDESGGMEPDAEMEGA